MGGPRPTRGLRWRAWLLGIAGSIVGLLILALLALQLAPVATGLTNAVLARLPTPPGASMRVHEVRGDWLTRLELRGLRMARGDTLLLAADTLAARYRLASLIEGRLDVSALDLAGVVVSAEIAGGTSRPRATKPRPTLADLLRGRFYHGPPIRVDRVTVRGARYGGRVGVADSTLHLASIEMRAQRVSLGGGFSFLLDSLAMRAFPAGEAGPSTDLSLAATLDDGRFEVRDLALRSAASEVEARGFVAVDARDSLAEGGLALRARPLALGDLDLLVPGLGFEGAVAADIDVHGPAIDKLWGTVEASTDRARFGALEFGPSRLDATLTDGRADAKLSAEYERARADVSGWIRPLDRTPTYDLDARIDRLPSRIPGAPWWRSLAERAGASVTLSAQGSGYRRAALSATGRADGAAGRVDFDGSLDLTSGFEWTVRRLAFENVDVARLAGDSVASAVSGTLAAAGRSGGSQPRAIEADLEIGPSSYGDWRIAGARARARLDGQDVGGSLRLDTDAGFLSIDSLAARWDSVGAFRVLGARFKDLDLERLTRRASLAGRLNGTLSGGGRGLASLRGPGGAVAALRDGRFSAEARVELAPSWFREQEISSGSARLSLAGGAVDAKGEIVSAAGRLDLDARARPFDEPPTYAVHEARFADVDLASWTGARGLRSRLSGRLTGEGHPGAGPSRGEGWTATLRLDPSRVGSADLGGGEARASWSGGQGQVVANLVAADDTMSARGTIAMDDGVPRGDAQLSIPFGAIATLAGHDSLESGGALEARTSFVGLSPATATMEGVVTGRGSIGVARLDSLLVRFHLERGTLDLDTLAARSNVGTAAGAGRVALFDSTGAASSDLHVALELTDVSPLRELLRADTVAVDSGTFDLRLGGSAVARTFEARGRLRWVTWNDVRLLELAGSARGALDGGWRPAGVDVEASLRRLERRGIRVSGAAARATLEGGETEFALAAILEDRERLRVAGRSLSDSLGTHVTLDTVDVRADSADSVAWTLARPTRLDIRPDAFAVEGLELRSPTGRIAADGLIDRRGDQDFRLDMENVGISVITGLLGRGVGGTLNGNLALEGPAAAPKGNGAVQLDLVSQDRPAGALSSNISWDGARLDLEGWLAAPSGDSLAWDVQLPLVVSLAPPDSADGAKRMHLHEGDVDVSVTANQFPLAALAPLLDPRSIGVMEGSLDVDARLRGSSRELVGSGRVAVVDGVVPLPGLGATYRDIELRGELQGNSLVLGRAHAASGKGHLDASGEIRFISATRIEPQLHVSAKRFVFADTPDLRAIGSGEVDIAGTLTSPTMKGTAIVENSTFTFTQSGVATAEPDAAARLSESDVRMMEETFGFVRPAGPSLPRRLYDASDLDLAVTLERNNWLRQRARPKMSVALTGKFQLRKAPHGEPELFGRIEPVPNRGYVEELARSFDITGGEVLLNGKTKDHRVSIQAQYKPPESSESGDSESDVVVHLDVQGSAERLKLTMSSEPAMTEGEILNYIATGRSPVSAPTGSSGQDASMAKDIGLSQVAGVAEGVAQEKMGLDVLRVRFDALQGATLVAGRYLDPQLYVGFRQPLQYTESGSPSSGATFRTSFEVEYATSPWLVLNVQGETSKLRSFIRARHAY